MPSKRRSFPHRVLWLLMAFQEPPSISVCHHIVSKDHQNYPKLVPLFPRICWKRGDAGCAILPRPPNLQDVCTCLVLESSMYVFDLHFSACAAPFSMGVGVFSRDLLCFLQFCMVLPSFLHSLPRLNGLERGVCHNNMRFFWCWARPKIGSHTKLQNINLQNILQFTGFWRCHGQQECASTSVSKSCQNTAICVSCFPLFLDIAKIVWIKRFFVVNPPRTFFCLQTRWYLHCFVFCASLLPKRLVFAIFLRFCIVPAKDAKT